MGSRSPSHRLLFAAVLLIAVLAAFAPPVPAARASGENAVTIDVGAILASNEGSSMDPALSGIRGKLRVMFNYTSYRMVARKARTLAVGETGKYDLPGRRTMQVTVLPFHGNRVRLLMRLQEEGRNLLTTTLGLPRGGMVLVGGPPFRSGVLILVIAAE
jgi:hypothetical protein